MLKLAVNITDFVILQTTRCQEVTDPQNTLQGEGLVTGGGRGAGLAGKTLLRMWEGGLARVWRDAIPGLGGGGGWAG